MKHVVLNLVRMFTIRHWILAFLAMGALTLAGASALSSTPAIQTGSLAQPLSTPSDGFTNFETEPVRPLALSPDGRYLFALNTADDRMEIFDTQGDKLQRIGEITVGLRPVSIALRGQRAWVVNHLSDSVSVVDISNPAEPRLTHTLPVGDEPRDIVVGGGNHDRIFITAARRDQTLTPGIGRAHVWVFNAEQPDAPPKIVTLFGTKPRALAVSADGHKVFAAIFRSGNGTAAVFGETAVQLFGRMSQVDPLDPGFEFAFPKQGPIVKKTPTGWRDFTGMDWSATIAFDLPDYDVFVIDASASIPKPIQSISNVGTVLFNLAVHPLSGDLWVTNTEALNWTPYETALQGRFAQNRITRIGQRADKFGPPDFIDLNPHLKNPAATQLAQVRAQSLAQPLNVVFEPDGRLAYVSAFGSGKVAVLDASGNVVDRIATADGPSGLALDTQRQRLYVLNHLAASLSVIDLRMRATVITQPLAHDPTLPLIKRGRSLLYDASRTSRHGDLSCATCHVFGDVDGLGWDLGDPHGQATQIPPALRAKGIPHPRQSYHPLKGPMVTQSLRGLAGTAPYHWRGDRFGTTTTPGEDIPSFKSFNAAFVALMGLDQEFADAEMDAFARFAMSMRFPPNPNQPLDRTLTGEAREGLAFFTGPIPSVVAGLNCEGCHAAPAGTNRLINFEGIHIGRDFKTPQLRNVYDKVGRFNSSGSQVSGFGLIHDGSIDTVLGFLRLDVFVFPGWMDSQKDRFRRHLHHYVMAFDTGMAPAVGRQVTVTGVTKVSDEQLLNVLSRRAKVGDCDLVAKGWHDKRERGWLHGNGLFHGDVARDKPMDLNSLLERFRANGESLTFTCVPPGDGRRSALDRDLDGHLNGDEFIAGSNPADARSTPSKP